MHETSSVEEEEEDKMYKLASYSVCVCLSMNVHITWLKCGVYILVSHCKTYVYAVLCDVKNFQIESYKSKRERVNKTRKITLFSLSLSLSLSL